MAVRVRAKSAQAKAFLTAFARQFDPVRIAAIVETVAWWTYRELVLHTPKRWTGLTRRNWRVVRTSRGWMVTNLSKIMLFLEAGTVAHGAVTAKMLFIPLNSRAAIGGWNAGLKYGKDYILRKRVRGIKAMHIVEQQRPRTRNKLFAEMTAYVGRVRQSNK